MRQNKTVCAKNEISRKCQKNGGYFVLLLLLVLLALSAVFGDRMINAVEKRIYPRAYPDAVLNACAAYDVPPSVAFGVMKTESGFDPAVQSSKGAQGLMQIMPDTYDWICSLRGKDSGAAPLADPETNIDTGVWFLSYLYEKFGDWNTVYAAYNAGHQRVSDWLKDETVASGGVLVHIPYPETRRYVGKVMRARNAYIRIYGMK